MAATGTKVRLKADERREKLIRAARKLFTKNGYDATRMDEIAEAAQCTTGPLYHFFSTKRDIFEAALRQSTEVANERSRERRNASGESSPLKRLQQNCNYLFDLLSIPETTMFIREAPRVLGSELWRKLRDGLMLRSFEHDLREAMMAGEIPPEPPGPLAGILGAAIVEAVNQVNEGHSDQVEAYRAALKRLVARLAFAPPAD